MLNLELKLWGNNGGTGGGTVGNLLITQAGDFLVTQDGDWIEWR